MSLRRENPKRYRTKALRKLYRNFEQKLIQTVNKQDYTFDDLVAITKEYKKKEKELKNNLS